MAGKLFVVGTPIGNLGDFSPRAVETLRAVDFIAAEDTRVTVKLLNKFEIDTPMVSYHEHNLRERGEMIIARILKGENCAVVSDAGMPAISDPGEDLVRLCHKNGIKVESVPGPSAVITALALSGMPAGRFCFEGFLTTGKSGRREHLVKLKDETRTMIFYEAPHKLLATLEDMLKCFGDREISVVKEITKLHEDVMNTTLSEAISEFSAVSPKGEFVLIVKGAEERKEEEMTFSDAVEYAKKLIKEGNSLTFSAKQAAAMSEFKKSEIYSAVLSEK